MQVLWIVCLSQTLKLTTNPTFRIIHMIAKRHIDNVTYVYIQTALCWQNTVHVMYRRAKRRVVMVRLRVLSSWLPKHKGFAQRYARKSCYGFWVVFRGYIVYRLRVNVYVTFQSIKEAMDQALKILWPNTETKIDSFCNHRESLPLLFILNIEVDSNSNFQTNSLDCKDEMIKCIHVNVPESTK